MEPSLTVLLAIDRPRASRTGALEDPASDRWSERILIAACLLGALRFVFLGRWSLWVDEAFTLADANHGLSSRNPLGYFVFGLWYRLVDGRPGEFLLRLPAAFFGWLTIPATYWVLREFFGRRAAALAAFLVAASSWHLYWSQNARFYTLAQFLVLVGSGALLRGLTRSSGGATVGGILALGCASLTHPSAVLLAAPLMIIPWVARFFDAIPEEAEGRTAWRILSAAGFVMVLLGSGWVLDVWATWQRRQSTGSPLHFLMSTGYLLGPTLCLAYAAGLAWCLREKRTFVPTLACALALAGAFVASLFVRVSAQYVFVLLPWIAVVAARGILLFAPEHAPRRQLALLALVAAPGLIESALYFSVRNGDRPHWREAYRYVFEHRDPDDLILAMEAPVAEYYLDPSTDDLRMWKATTWLDDFRADHADEWARYERPTWFVINREQLEDWGAENREQLLKTVRGDCRLAARFEIPFTPRDLDVFVYRRE